MKDKTKKGAKDLGPLLEEIKLFIQYGIKESERAAAEELVAGYKDNPMALQIFKDFYSRLPGLREEAIVQITKVVSRLKMFLVAAKTEKFEYLYFFDGKSSFYLGEKKDGIEEKEILKFFGYSSNADFLKQQATSSNLPVTSVDNDRGKVFCPSCSVGEGELHHLGCPVEICPWCDTQLSYCNCRFDKLGVEEILSEEQLDLFEIVLNEKGRLSFSREQAPSYPEDGKK